MRRRGGKVPGFGEKLLRAPDTRKGLPHRMVRQPLADARDDQLIRPDRARNVLAPSSPWAPLYDTITPVDELPYQIEKVLL